eukprot:EG_transcript_14454
MGCRHSTVAEPSSSIDVGETPLPKRCPSGSPRRRSKASKKDWKRLLLPCTGCTAVAWEEGSGAAVPPHCARQPAGSPLTAPSISGNPWVDADSFTTPGTMTRTPPRNLSAKLRTRWPRIQTLLRSKSSDKFRRHSRPADLLAEPLWLAEYARCIDVPQPPRLRLSNVPSFVRCSPVPIRWESQDPATDEWTPYSPQLCALLDACYALSPLGLCHLALPADPTLQAADLSSSSSSIPIPPSQSAEWGAGRWVRFGCMKEFSAGDVPRCVRRVRAPWGEAPATTVILSPESLSFRRTFEGAVEASLPAAHAGHDF